MALQPVPFLIPPLCPPRSIRSGPSGPVGARLSKPSSRIRCPGTTPGQNSDRTQGRSGTERGAPCLRARWGLPYTRPTVQVGSRRSAAEGCAGDQAVRRGDPEATSWMVDRRGPPRLHRRRRPGGQRAGRAPPGDGQSPGHQRLPGPGQGRMAAGPPLHRPQRRLHHPGPRPPGRPRLAARPRPLVEPVRGGGHAAGRRDAERRLLPVDPGARPPPGHAGDADPAGGDHRVGHLRPGHTARGGTDLLDGGRGGLRAVRHLCLAGPRAHPARGPAPAVPARRGAGPRRRP